MNNKIGNGMNIDDLPNNSMNILTGGIKKITNNIDKIKLENKFKNILGVKYFPNINETGKNILLIGEQHINIDNYEYLLKFFNDIIEKCQEREKCLDFFIEGPLICKKVVQANNGFLSRLRNELKKYYNNVKYNLFRLHFIDIRLSASGKNIDFQYDSYVDLINIVDIIILEQHNFDIQPE